jgi:hypothetical protein
VISIAASATDCCRCNEAGLLEGVGSGGGASPINRLPVVEPSQHEVAAASPAPTTDGQRKYTPPKAEALAERLYAMLVAAAL